MALIRAAGGWAGYRTVVAPGDHGLQWLSFGLLRLADGEQFEHLFPASETVLVLLSGQCDIRAGAEEWHEVGHRADVFSGPAAAAYLPPGCPFRVTGRGQAEVAMCGATADTGPGPTLILPEGVRVRRVGKGAYAREVHDIVTCENVPARRVLVGETFNYPGCWSSYPPHKHDCDDPPQERALEEIYHFRVKPTQGFGLQRVYGNGAEECRVVQDGDTVVITRGFHPVVAAPGYQLYYLWALAGETRELVWREDPAHEWVSRTGGTGPPGQ